MAGLGEMPEEVDFAVSPSPPESPMNTSGDSKDLDLAFKYIQDAKHGADEALAENVDLRALRRKIDRRILPVMFLCYTMQFLDKVNINVSKAAPKLFKQVG